MSQRYTYHICLFRPVSWIINHACNWNYYKLSPILFEYCCDTYHDNINQILNILVKNYLFTYDIFFKDNTSSVEFSQGKLMLLLNQLMKIKKQNVHFSSKLFPLIRSCQILWQMDVYRTSWPLPQSQFYHCWSLYNWYFKMVYRWHHHTPYCNCH